MSGEELQPFEAKAVARALTGFCGAVSNSLKASPRCSSKTSLVSRICGLRSSSASSSSSSSSSPFAETQVRALMVRARLRREEALQTLMLEQAIKELPDTWTPSKKLEALTARCAACSESRREHNEYNESRKTLKRRVVKILDAADSAGGGNKDSKSGSKRSLKDIEESRGFVRRRRTKKKKLFGVAET